MFICSANSNRRMSTASLTSLTKFNSNVVLTSFAQSRSTESVVQYNEIKILPSQSKNPPFVRSHSTPFRSTSSPSKYTIQQRNSRKSSQLAHLNVWISRKLAKFTKEKKAAKTLGTVMGIFIICWLPFFITNVISGICGQIGVECILSPHIVWPVLTWLGWINSAMNPFIYAYCSKDFRRYV